VISPASTWLTNGEVSADNQVVTNPGAYIARIDHASFVVVFLVAPPPGEDLSFNYVCLD